MVDVMKICINGILLFLYFVARFLELDSLSHKCEDLLVDSISLDNVIALINWSKEPHGSKYVYRNCLVYLREDYVNFCGSPGFFEIDRSIFCELISSDFVQVVYKYRFFFSSSYFFLFLCLFAWHKITSFSRRIFYVCV